ncbi:MAG: ABC transporter permease [Candidatus Hydrogenedentes bacterium]|nr:ABC transporter permease [Candidatus Hydrogenedentota bacterium]
MSEIRLKCPDTLNAESGPALLEEVKGGLPEEGQNVVLDFSRTRSMDSMGSAWLMRLAEAVRGRGGELRWEHASGDVVAFLDLVKPGLLTRPTPPERAPGFFEATGGSAINMVTELREFWNLVIDTIYWTVLAPFEGRGFRWGLFIDEMHEMGVRAVQIVCLMNFLLGLIVAMLLSKQAEAYGIQIFVADVVMIGFARELGAVMTATVVSARTGAAIAAEIATMQVQEEIDALRGMGLNVTQFLVSPKLLAMLVVLPCLVALGIVCGVLGGAVWGIFVLDFEPSVWFNETLQRCELRDIVEGMTKTIVFAVMIVLVGCHNGLRVTGGSRGVGLMTTRAVVMDIFFMIIIDIQFATLFYYVLE